MNCEVTREAEAVVGATEPLGGCTKGYVYVDLKYIKYLTKI